MNYTKAIPVDLKSDPDLREKWVQERISEDPAILGLGDLVLKDSERIQPQGGRLDLLLQDPESNNRFEVEIQLGRTDESHIIRTIEYWDVERRRYPQYDHTAVIIAEDITSRFLNVISLFNGTLPLAAIQMRALRVGDALTLTFARVLDQTVLGNVGDDEEVAEVTDRSYWEARTPEQMLAEADRAIDLVQTLDPRLEPKYNKFYIGIARDGRPNNFVFVQPLKKHVRMVIRLPESEEVEAELEGSGLDIMDYNHHSGRYRIRIKPGDVAKNEELLAGLFRRAQAFRAA